MTLSDVVKRGALTLRKNSNKYIIEFSGYHEYGTLTRRTFEARNLKLAYMKLEEYLKYNLAK